MNLEGRRGPFSDWMPRGYGATVLWVYCCCWSASRGTGSTWMALWRSCAGASKITRKVTQCFVSSNDQQHRDGLGQTPVDRRRIFFCPSRIQLRSVRAHVFAACLPQPGWFPFPHIENFVRKALRVKMITAGTPSSASQPRIPLLLAARQTR